jgi:mannosidase alpha-like ER degradation enhancer 2
MAAAPRRLQQQHRHRARRRTITTTTLLILFVAVCAPSPTPLRAALAANATDGAAATPPPPPPPPVLADVAAARAAWAGTGWAGAPLALPRRTAADPPAPPLQEQALDLFDGALLAYLKHAFPRDNLLPLSCTGQDWQGGGMALTLVDALDSLLLLPGRGHLLPPAVEALRRRGVPRAGTPAYDRDAKVHVFETTIRVLGGLLSAHVLLQRLGPQELAPPLSSPSSSAAAEAARALLLDAAAGQGRPNNNGTTPHYWRYDGFLLHLARDLGDRMLPAFRTPSGVPLAWAHLRGARRTAALAENHATCTACAGTLLLEFGLLSHLTGENKYRAVASRAADALFARRTRLGLVGSELSVAMALGGGGEVEDEAEEHEAGNYEDDDDEYEDPPPEPGQEQAPKQQRASPAAAAPAPHPHHLNPGPAASSPWTSALSTIGPGSDSYYEYLLKAFLQTGDKTRLREFCALFSGVQRLMALGSSSAVGPKNAAFVLDVRADDGRLAKPWVSSLGAFWPGLQALVGQTDAASALVANFSSAAAMHGGWLPEVFAADLGGAVHSSDAGWRLRPELAESAFLLHAANGDPRLRSAVAAPIARALRAVRRGGVDGEDEGARGGAQADSSAAAAAARPSPLCPGALAHVADVRTGALEDASESYALSETLKYVSLIATPGSGALVDAFVLTTEGHVAPAEPREQTRGDGRRGDGDGDEAAADEAEAEDLARQGLLPSPSTPLLPPACRSLCADAGPSAARNGRERAAARAVVDSLSRALPLVRAREQEVVRLRRRRCAACVAVAQHLQQHPPEPPARRAARLNFGGAAFVAPLPSPPSPRRRRPLRPPPLRVPLPPPRRTAPPFHPPAHHRPPPAPEPLAAAVCVLDAGRWALSLRREPLRCSQAQALGALDLSTGQMPQSAVVLQLARVVGPAVGAEEASGSGGSGNGGGNNGEGEDAGADGLLPAHGLIVSFEDGKGNINSSSDVVWFDATPPHFGPRPPLVARPECVALLRAPRPRLAAQAPCPAHAPLLLSFGSASSSSRPNDGFCPSADACEEAVAASAHNTTNSLLLRACAGGLDPSAAAAAAASSSSFPIPRWLPDAELDDPARPCGLCEIGAGVPMLASPLVVAQPFDACVSSSAPPLNNAPFLRGAIALVERGGGCSFVDKVLAVQSAGAAGAVVLNTPRAASAAARDKARQRQQGAVADRGTCSAAEAAAAAASGPPEYQHPSAMADDAWRGGERPRIPAVMLAPGASAALLKAVRERGGGVATLVARHARAGSMAVGEDGVVVEIGEDDQKEEEGDYGDDDEEEEGKAKAEAAAADAPTAAAANATTPPLTWLTLDRLHKKRVRERVDLLIPPASRDFVTKFVLAPLHQQRQRWEAEVAALMMAGGGGALGRAAAAAGAIPAPPLMAEEAFSQLAFDPKVKEVLAAGRAETLQEEKRAARAVASAAAALERRRRRQRRMEERKKGQHD